MHKIIKMTFAFLAASMLFVAQAAALDDGNGGNGGYMFVVDNAGLLTNPEKEKLTAFLTELNDTKNVQLAVLTVTNPTGDDFYDFAGKYWENLKEKSTNFLNGALLAILNAEGSYKFTIISTKKVSTVFPGEEKNKILKEYFVSSSGQGHDGENILRGTVKMAGIITGDKSLRIGAFLAGEFKDFDAGTQNFTVDSDKLYNWTGSYVVDTKHFLTDEKRIALKQYLMELAEKTGVQVALLTVEPELGTDTQDYAKRQFNKWNLGKNGVDKGALILVRDGTQEFVISTGDVDGGILTDVIRENIIEDILKPVFNGGDKSTCLESAVKNVAGILTGNESLVTVSKKKKEAPLWFFGFMALLVLAAVGYFVFNIVKDKADEKKCKAWLATPGARAWQEWLAEHSSGSSGGKSKKR